MNDPRLNLVVVLAAVGVLAVMIVAAVKFVMREETRGRQRGGRK